jgi:hypothetical protein
LNEDLKGRVTEVIQDGTSSVGVNIFTSGDDDEPEAVKECRSAERFSSPSDVGEFRCERFRYGEDDGLCGTDRSKEGVSREVGSSVG